MKRSSGIYASDFGVPNSRGYRRAMGKALGEKIKRLRIALGMNQGELADKLGVTQASVSRWENGSMPDADKLAQLSELAGESVRSFIEGTGNETDLRAVLNRFWVRGVVAAGVFAPAYEWSQDEWTPYSGGEHIKAPEGTRFGLKCSGESMNLVYPDGTIVDCVQLDAYVDQYGEIESGKRVIVERHNFAGEVEATVKEYVRAEDGREWLVPRSNNPAFQAPISATEPGEGIETVKIVAVVVGSYRPE